MPLRKLKAYTAMSKLFAKTAGGSGMLWEGFLAAVSASREVTAKRTAIEADEDGKTALDHAIARDDARMIELLQNHGGRIGDGR